LHIAAATRLGLCRQRLILDKRRCWWRAAWTTMECQDDCCKSSCFEFRVCSTATRKVVSARFVALSVAARGLLGAENWAMPASHSCLLHILPVLGADAPHGTPPLDAQVLPAEELRRRLAGSRNGYPPHVCTRTQLAPPHGAYTACSLCNASRASAQCQQGM
jgi:hypothetical protein